MLQVDKLNTKSLFRENKRKIFVNYIYISYLVLILSLGENIKNISLVNEFSIINNLISLRSLAPYIILPINIILIIILGRFKNINNIINFFIIFIFLQIIGLYLRGFDLFHLQFIVGTLSIISLIILINNKEDIKILKNLIYITLLVISIIFLIYVAQNPVIYGGGNITLFTKKIIFINSNGISRYLVLIYSFLLAIFVFTKNKYLIFFPIFLVIGIIIFKFEGRFNILTFCTISLFVFYKNDKILKNLFTIIILIFLSIYFSIVWENKEKNKNSLSDINIYSLDIKNSPTNRFAPDGEEYSVKKELIQEKTAGNLTTGRTDKWKLLLNYKQNKKNIILGNGPEFDRNILLKNTPTGTDSANALIYVYLCGGLVSLLAFILLGIDQLHKVTKIILNKIILKDKIIFISIMCFIIISSRVLVENSISVWSLDQILFILFGSIINLQKINK